MERIVRFVMHPDFVDNSYYGRNMTKINYINTIDTTIEKTLDEKKYHVFVMSSKGSDNRFKKKFPKSDRIIYLNTPPVQHNNVITPCGEMGGDLQYYYDMIREINPEIIEGDGAFLTMCVRNSILQQYLKLYENKNWFRRDYQQKNDQIPINREQERERTRIIRDLERKEAFRKSKFRLGVVVTDSLFPLNQRIHIIHKSGSKDAVSTIQKTGNMIYQLIDWKNTRMFGAMNELLPDGTLIYSAWNDRIRYMKEVKGKPKKIIPLKEDANLFEIDMKFKQLQKQ